MKYLEWKEKVKLHLFTDNISVYVENPAKLPKTAVELISVFCKIANYKINMQNLIVFLYTSNEQSEIKNLNNVQ